MPLILCGRERESGADDPPVSAGGEASERGGHGGRGGRGEGGRAAPLFFGLPPRPPVPAEGICAGRGRH